jgi:A/G-specific adenine glycosylase
LEKEMSAPVPSPYDRAKMLPFKKAALVRRILSWYRRHGRQLPWRQTRDPYAIWVSEIMLQQTQVATVIPYYHGFLKSFPTVTALAAAPPDEVVKSWENLGYYHRARLMHRAAKVMAEEWDGKLPSNHGDLLRMPGIGPYTAGAIASIAFGKRIPALDGNSKRVYARLFAVVGRTDGRGGEARISGLAQRLLPASDSGTFNQAIMDLGATLCTPRNPSCPLCPLTAFCLAFAKGLQARLPTPKKRRGLPHKDMTASVITDRAGMLLIVKRPEHGLLPGLWKLPGGERCEEGTLAEALERRVLEELGVMIKVLEPVVSVKHTFTHFRMTLHAFRARIRNGKPKSLTCARLAWVRPADLAGYAFSKADRTIVHHLLASSANDERQMI